MEEPVGRMKINWMMRSFVESIEDAATASEVVASVSIARDTKPELQVVVSLIVREKLS